MFLQLLSIFFYYSPHPAAADTFFNAAAVHTLYAGFRSATEAEVEVNDCREYGWKGEKKTKQRRSFKEFHS